MPRAKIGWPVFRDSSWIHWAATIPLLEGHIAGIADCLEAAIALCIAVAFGMWMRLRSVLAMPVQVRLAYAALLVVGIVPGMFWIYYVQLVGTTAMVVFGYCPLVRMLTLLPWNRSEPITGPWLSRLLLAAAPGGLVDFSLSSTPTAACSCSCSLPSTGSGPATAPRAT